MGRRIEHVSALEYLGCGLDESDTEGVEGEYCMGLARACFMEVRQWACRKF